MTSVTQSRGRSLLPSLRPMTFKEGWLWEQNLPRAQRLALPLAQVGKGWGGLTTDNRPVVTGGQASLGHHRNTCEYWKGRETPVCGWENENRNAAHVRVVELARRPSTLERRRLCVSHRCLGLL